MRALSTLLLMTISFFQAQGQSAADLAGTWNGKLNFPGQSLRLVIHLNEQEDGSWTGTLDSPDQQATGIVADEVRVNGDSLAFRIQRLRASFQGLYQDGKIEGTFEQAGMKLPLSLAREAIEGPRRPQTPAAPFPYQSEEVRFRSMDTLGLAGTLTIPAGEGPFPAVILITGSGPQDRDETIAGHKPFWVIADYLTRQGIAVLRYDERGVGKSDGDFSSATSYDFSVDAEAAMDFLLARPDIDKAKIGYLGHSEGGMVAPMIAARRPEVGFLILMAGPGVPGKEVLTSQEAEVLRQMGMPASTLDHWREARESVYTILAETTTESEFIQKLTSEASDILRPLSTSDKMALGVNEKNLAEKFAPLGSPWFRYFTLYDPAPTLQEVRCPVLAINGGKDVQVLPELNLSAISSALEEGGNEQVQVVLLPGLNHLFQPAETGMPQEYGLIETTLDPAFLQAIGEWLSGI